MCEWTLQTHERIHQWRLQLCGENNVMLMYSHAYASLALVQPLGSNCKNPENLRWIRHANFDRLE